MVFIYALKLENNKYYIGKTNNPSFRIEDHFNSNGSLWTKKYTPIQLVELIPDCDDYDEDKYTIKYMDKYGIENVRGGSFVSIKLDDSTIEHLTRMSDGTNDRCFKCGEVGHFANVCKNKIKYEYIEVWGCDYCKKEFDSEQKCNKHEKNCDKNREQCKCPTSFFTPHRKNKCLFNKIINDSSDDECNEDVIGNNCCFRCGREGHYANNCYAKTNINGKYLKKY